MKKFSVMEITRHTLGLTAMTLAVLFIYHYKTNILTLAASGYLFLICATDTLYSKIPNIFTLALMVIGLVTNVVISGLPGILVSLTGCIVGLALLLIPFFMGGMGAGDVKALAALGSLLGPGMTFHIFLYMALIGGLIGLFLHLLSSGVQEELRHYYLMFKNTYLTRDYKSFKSYKNRAKVRFPYATAIAFGYFALIHWGKIF